MAVGRSPRVGLRVEPKARGHDPHARVKSARSCARGRRVGIASWRCSSGLARAASTMRRAASAACVYSHFGGVEQDGVVGAGASARRRGRRRGRRGGGCRPARRRRLTRLALRLQLLPAALGAHLGRGGDVELGRGVGRDHRADVAPVEHRAAGLARRRRAGSRAGRRAPRGCTATRLAASPAARGAQRRDRPAGRRSSARAAAAAAASSSSRSLAGLLHQHARRRGRAGRCPARGRPKAAPSRAAMVPLPEAAGPSTAMTKPLTLSSRRSPRPGRASASTKPGKLVAIMPGSSTRDRLRRAARPSTRWLMAMRWSPWVATRPPPRDAVVGARRADDGQALGLLLDADAAGGQAGGHQGDAVALLDPQLADAAHDGRALGEGGGDGQDRIFVDHRGRALRRAPRRPSAANSAR